MSDKQPRRYSEREIGAILKRATEWQEERDETTASAPAGLTLEEIEEIAREVGVDADLVRRAATETVYTCTPEKGWHLLGAPIKVKHEAVMSAPAREEDLDEMVVAIRAHLGQKGRFEKLNGVLTWTSPERGDQVEISVVPKGKHTQVQGKQFFLGIAMSIFFLPLFFTLIIGSAYLAEEVGMPALLEIALLTGAMLAVFGLGRVGFKLWTRQQRQKMETLMQHLGGMLEDPPAPILTTEEEQASAKLEVPEPLRQETTERPPRRSSTR
ncbi:MAG TPA: hypothetical protein VKP65_06785 [Rhodothermales bacterium]|nr:hypothetical protein [Rhodothermales bacterium]